MNAREIASRLADDTTCVCGPDVCGCERERGWEHDCRFFHLAEALIQACLDDAWRAGRDATLDVARAHADCFTKPEMLTEMAALEPPK